MDWINRNMNTTVRVLSVDKGEVDVVAVDATILLRQPSAVLVLDVSTVDSRKTPEFDGKGRVAINDRPKMETRHTDDLSRQDSGIWAAPGVLKTEWATYIIMQQAEIARITAETNQWSENIGNKLLRYLGASRVTSQPHKSVADILSSIGSSYDTSPEIREQIMKLFANLAAKTRDLRQRVSALKSEMKQGITVTPETVEWENPLLLGIVDPGEPESEKKVSKEGEALTETNKVRTDSTREGARRDNNQITIDGDVTGETPKVISPTPPRIPNNIASQANTASQGEPLSVARQQRLTGNDPTDWVNGNKNTEKENGWDQAELTTASRHQKLTPRILEAPTATQHFSSALSGIERHWKELIEFEVSVRARKLELETIAREIRLTMEVGPHSAASDPENQDCTAEYDRLCGGKDKQTLLENCETSQRILQQEANNLKAKILGGENFFLATRNTEQALVQPNIWETVEIDSPMSTTSKPVPCVLEVPTRAMRKQRQMPVEDVEVTRENLITRGVLQRRDKTPQDNVQVNGESQNQDPTKYSQTVSAKMADSSGSATSAGAHLDAHHNERDTTSGSNRNQPSSTHDAYWLNLDGEAMEHGIPRGKPLAASSSLICMLDRDEHAPYGASYDHIFDKIAFAPHSKLEVIVGRLFNEYPFGLEEEIPGQTQIFFATIIDRRRFIGKAVPFACGLFLTTTNPVTGEPKLIRQGNRLYSEIVQAIEMRKEEKRLDLSCRMEPVARADLRLKNLAGESEISFTMRQGAKGDKGPPLIELETDLVRLQAITAELEPLTRDRIRTIVPRRIYINGQDALGAPVAGPMANTTKSLVHELTRQVIMVSERSQNETHCRDAMRVDPRALNYLTELLPAEEAKIFKFIVTVMTVKHGIDSLHTYTERANVNGVIAHLDYLIHHTMQKIPFGEPLEFPCVTEYELQHNIRELMKINPYMWHGRQDFGGLPVVLDLENHMSQLSSNARHLIDGDCRYNPHKIVYDKQPDSSLIAPGTLLSSLDGTMSLADVLEPFPWNVALVPQDLTEEQANEAWRHEAWKRGPKVIAYNSIGMPEPKGHGEEITGAHPHITRVVSYPVLEAVSGRHLIMPEPPSAPLNQPVFTTGSHTFDRLFQTLLDQIAVPTSARVIDEANGQPEQMRNPSSNETEKEVGRESDEKENQMELDQDHVVAGSVSEDERQSRDESLFRSITGAVEREEDKKQINVNQGHVIDAQPVSAYRRSRASSLPSSLQHLSIREPQLDVEQDDPDATKDDDLVPLAPMLLARAAPELEEGEISEISELEGIQQDLKGKQSYRRNFSTIDPCTATITPKHERAAKASPANPTNAPEESPEKLSRVPLPVISVFAHHQDRRQHFRSYLSYKSTLFSQSKDLADDDDDDRARGSTEDSDMVFSAAVAGPSSHSNRMLVDQGTTGGFQGGVLDFWRQERSGCNLSSQSPSAEEPEIFRLVELSEAKGRVIRDVESLTFVRPTRELEFVGDKDSDVGDETSAEKENGAAEKDQDGQEATASDDVATLGHSGTAEKSEQTKEREIRKGNEESSDSEGYYDTREYGTNDILSWRADLKLAEELVSQASVVSRSPVGSTGSSSPPPQTETDEMDTSSDDYIGQYREPINQTGERNFPRVPFNVNDPNSTVTIRGEHTMTEMHYLYHMYQRKAVFPDSIASPAAMEEAEFIHYPSATRDFTGYRDHSQSTIDETTNFRPESGIQQRNPDRIPGPGSSVIQRPCCTTGPCHQQVTAGQLSATDDGLPASNRSRSGAKIIAHGMSYTRPDVEDYCLVNADEDVCRWEHEKDEEEFLRIQEYGCMLEFVVPIDADLAEAMFNGNEQELMHLERTPDPLRRYQQLSTSATSIHGSPLAFWLSPL
ncbi:hypothetical protein C8J56DRAFT_903923 [Mycena floridula]|nr:hypothetical protein C8J56DRAFT_903923 [Mycena floridula]